MSGGSLPKSSLQCPQARKKRKIDLLQLDHFIAPFQESDTNGVGADRHGTAVITTKPASLLARPLPFRE